MPITSHAIAEKRIMYAFILGFSSVLFIALLCGVTSPQDYAQMLSSQSQLETSA